MRRNVKTAQKILPCLKKTVRYVKFSCIQNLLYQGSWKFGINEEKSREICNDILEQYDFSKNDPKNKIDKIIDQIENVMNEEHNKLVIQLQQNPQNKNLIIRIENLNSENNFFTRTIDLLKTKAYECPICQVDQIKEEKIILSGCFHWICYDCYQSLKKHFVQVECPICRSHILDNELLMHPRFFENSESKLDALMSEIQSIPQKEKIIIFTQYHNLIIKLCSLFDQAKVNYIVLKGVPKKINIRLQKFKTMPEIRVILMSIEQAASGINLQEANHVFFAHPIWIFS